MAISPMNLQPPSARSSLSMGGGIDPVGDVQSNYLNTLMAGVVAGQDRRKKLQERRAALQAQASNALGNAASPVGGEQVANANGDWGNPIGDPNFAKNYLTGIRLPNGKMVQVHKNIAQNVSGFMNALWNQGYKFSDVGTYNKRMVNSPKGSGGLWSRHSTGLAIDIDPMKNPWGGKNIALPKNVGQLAQQYGLSWLGPKNGDWMHFGYTAPTWKGIAPN